MSVSEFSYRVDWLGPTAFKTYLHVINREHIRGEEASALLMSANHDTGQSAGDKDLRSHLRSAAV